MAGIRKLLIVGAALVSVAAVLLIAWPAETASADGGPHGGYTATGGSAGGLPDQCAACHRVHQGKSVGKLLKASSPYALCLTCHNGAGSELDVWDGVKLAAVVPEDSGAVGIATTTNLTVSVAPRADLAINFDTGTAEYTVSVSSRQALADPFAATPAAWNTIDLSLTETPLGGAAATDFASNVTFVQLGADGTTIDGFTVSGGAQAKIFVESLYRTRASTTYTFSATGANLTMTAPASGGFAAQSQTVTLSDMSTAFGTQTIRFDTLGGMAIRLVHDGTTNTITGTQLAAGFVGRTLTTGAATTGTAGTIRIPPQTGSGTAAVPGVTYFDITIQATGATQGTNESLIATVVSDLNGGGAETPTIAVQARAETALAGQTLLGGGFMFVNGEPTTSRHNADPADNSLRPWGFNANTGQELNTLSSALQCTSCHNPHGTTNYRLLKETINGQTVNVKVFYDADGNGLTEDSGPSSNTQVFGKDEGAPGLDDAHSAFDGTARPADKYTKEYYGSSANAANGGKGDPGVASLCGACHTAYPSDGASNPYTAGGVTHYRHKTEMPYADWTNPDTARVSQNPETTPISTANNPSQTNFGDFPSLRLASNASEDNTVVTCLTCHRVHGTNTTMSGYAVMAKFGGLGDNDLTPSQQPLRDPTSTSTLLYTDNRGMCEACHQWGITVSVPSQPLVSSTSAAQGAAGDGNVTVTFTAPLSNGGSAVTGYTVRSFNATTNAAGPTASGAASPIAVTGLTNGTTYYFTVEAANAEGTGPASRRTNQVQP